MKKLLLITVSSFFLQGCINVTVTNNDNPTTIADTDDKKDSPSIAKTNTSEKTPSSAQAEALVNKTIYLFFDDARKDDFTKSYHQFSELWKNQMPQDKLNKVFASLIKYIQENDITQNIKNKKVTFHAIPATEEDEYDHLLLKTNGTYVIPENQVEVTFEIDYIKEEGIWKPFRMAIEIIPMANQAKETTQKKKPMRRTPRSSPKTTATKTSPTLAAKKPDTKEIAAVPVKIDPCETAYQKLITDLGEDFSECQGQINLSECEKRQKENANKKSNIVLIIDASGSMNPFVHGKSKINIAKETSMKFIDQLKDDVNLSIVLYGHKGNNQNSGKAVSCAGIDEIYSLKGLNKASAKAEISKIKAVGFTPIAGALEKAKSILSAYPSDKYINSVILISDGEETCGGEPAITANILKSANISVTTSVIGFDVGGTAEKQLKNIAQNGGGQYYSARTEKEFEKAFSNFSSSFCTLKSMNARTMSDLSYSQKSVDCSMKLHKEYSKFFGMKGVLHPRNAGKEVAEGVSDQCRKHIDDRYSERYDSIKNQISETLKQGRKDVENAFQK